MKKRTNIFFEEEDRRMIQFLQTQYGLDSEAAVVRFLVRKAAKEEGYVSGEKSQHRQNSSNLENCSSQKHLAQTKASDASVHSS
jgi:hypothetical protein